MKYISAEKLITEIEKRAKFHDDAMKACVSLNNIAITHSAGWKEDTELLALIDSLQQEQSEMDLEKEFDGFLNKKEGVPRMWHSDEQIEWAKDIARHFYELARLKYEK